MVLNLGLATVSIACKRRQLERLLGVPDPRCTLPKKCSECIYEGGGGEGAQWIVDWSVVAGAWVGKRE